MKYVLDASEKLRTLTELGPYDVPQVRAPPSLAISLQLFHSKALDPEALNLLMDIAYTNMQSRHYEPYSRETAKLNIVHRHSYVFVIKELSLSSETPDASYNPKEHIAGFLAFRPIIENGIFQLYIWELQLAPAYQRKGLGQMLILSLLELGQTIMPTRNFSLCLTCSKRNESGYAAYKSMGFKLSEDNDDAEPFWILELKSEEVSSHNRY